MLTTTNRVADNLLFLIYWSSTLLCTRTSTCFNTLEAAAHSLPHNGIGVGASLESLFSGSTCCIGGQTVVTRSIAKSASPHNNMTSYDNSSAS